MRPFQIGLLSSFAILGVLSVVLLAGFDIVRNQQENPYGDGVIIWGTLDEQAFYQVFIDVTQDNKNFKVVEYYEKDPRTFEEELVNAIAEGRSPDAILLPSEDLVTYRSKIQPIPYETLPQRTFKDQYLDGFEIFMLPEGTYALPFAVDPLILYWNRDILAAAGLAEAPRSWESLVNLVAPAVTVRNSSREIIMSTIAFGEFRNVLYATEVISMLIMQSGSRMVEATERGYEVALDDPVVEGARKPMEAALQFFLDFSNANSALYSWNRSQPDDLTAFLAEDLALYFAKGSDYQRIRELNPNFNFDVAPVPQGATATTKRSYGTFYGFAILKASQNKNGAYQAISTITSPAVSATITERVNLAPANRSLIAAGSSDPFRQLIMQQALVARSWLIPDKNDTDGIFQLMVEDVSSNRLKVGNAVSDAVRRLELAY